MGDLFPEDAELLRRAASLLYDSGDTRRDAWPDEQTLGKLRHDLRSLADLIDNDTQTSGH